MKKNLKSISKVYRNEDEILIVTAKTEGCAGRQYVSVTANSIQPILKDEAKRQVRENLEEGEMWRMAVEHEQTELGLDEWVEMVLSNDELDGFDNSLYADELTIEGEDYLFDSRSCGCLHEDIKSVTHDFDALIEMHLRDGKESIEQAEALINNMEAHDIDHEVERFTREIIGIEA